MFERPHHQRIAQVLSALDGPLLRDNGCLFGGGTAIALRHGEYRESVDIDFLVSDVSGYRALRQILTGAQGITAIVREDATPPANSDRWRDDGVFSRDLIDLAMMSPAPGLLRQAVAKAEQAYGRSVLGDLAKALDRLQTRPGWLDRCMQAMSVAMPRAVLWQKLRSVGRVLPKGDAAA